MAYKRHKDALNLKLDLDLVQAEEHLGIEEQVIYVEGFGPKLDVTPVKSLNLKPVRMVQQNTMGCGQTDPTGGM
ncbi:hypothetical protein RRG08_040974 [Elysia crispata]|uniref:Uncharacterized protein n=1 Tax=Elysia crispata TaxID=231223 RepID=A0AAE0Z151_9GAST|nr:hypothetical protein RRG08_040974 [Elysia crispata]